MFLLVQSVRAASRCLSVLSSFNFSFLGFISDLVAEIQVSAFVIPNKMRSRLTALFSSDLILDDPTTTADSAVSRLTITVSTRSRIIVIVLFPHLGFLPIFYSGLFPIWNSGLFSDWCMKISR
ncbi:hypothetical protein V6N13_016344 [Hibiscus sabdariffa]|uniref:Uncharacterized protein n=2 Tax=Hibiscus sabdariffa TaxID=183260 RepID=A0ABR2BH19_9ROSI